jgi:hypothetical protein
VWWMMLAVFAIGFGLHLVITAWRVRGNDLHRHSYVLWIEDGRIASCSGEVRFPFRRRYLRSLLGQPWRGPGVCTKILGLHEYCWMRPVQID